MVHSSFRNGGASFAMNDSQNNNFVSLDSVDHFVWNLLMKCFLAPLYSEGWTSGFLSMH